jgi:MbtH protein
MIVVTATDPNPLSATRPAMSETSEEIYVVVVNHEEQYSIWPEYKAIPAGWKAVDIIGSKQICLDYAIEDNGVSGHVLIEYSRDVQICKVPLRGRIKCDMELQQILLMQFRMPMSIKEHGRLHSG